MDCLPNYTKNPSRSLAMCCTFFHLISVVVLAMCLKISWICDKAREHSSIVQVQFKTFVIPDFCHCTYLAVKSGYYPDRIVHKHKWTTFPQKTCLLDLS